MCLILFKFKIIIHFSNIINYMFFLKLFLGRVLFFCGFQVVLTLTDRRTYEQMYMVSR